jgi:ACT domain-containing protein
MPIKQYTLEEIFSKLQQIEIFVATGDLVQDACQEVGVSKQSYYRWKKKFGVPRIFSSRSSPHPIDMMFEKNN